MGEAMTIELWHYGVKGMKWGVRRSKEELAKAREERLESSEDSVILKDGAYLGNTGCSCDAKKISGWCLDPKRAGDSASHTDEFLKVGYRFGDDAKLASDLIRQHDYSKRYDVRRGYEGAETYSIDMELGVDTKKKFRTVWQKNDENSQSRFITAYIDRRTKEGGN